VDRLLQAWRKPYKASADSLVAVYNTMTPEQRKDSVWRKTAGIIMRATNAGYDSVNRVFIATHLNSYISLVAFQQLELTYNFNPDTAAAKFSRFPASLRESALGKKLAAVIEKGKQTNIGITAMDFMVNDTTGKAVKLSDFHGHYVLVDFWASWCKPCRAENPNLLKAYNKYKNKNFTILGVSLDEDVTRRAWVNAVKKDSLPWAQVSELKGFLSKAAVLYGVTAIPSNFLINPNGKIIARNLRGEELDKKLGELFSM
jgi:peroxiredoxin